MRRHRQHRMAGGAALPAWQRCRDRFHWRGDCAVASVQLRSQSARQAICPGGSGLYFELPYCCFALLTMAVARLPNLALQTVPLPNNRHRGHHSLQASIHHSKPMESQLEPFWGAKLWENESLVKISDQIESIQEIQFFPCSFRSLQAFSGRKSDGAMRKRSW